ncbi:MAG: type IV secretory system conjugative DNA transfer family protein [Oscillospiraceae bacterium]|nr:type IV secretory system conjugative DNA transfer family protein [Oscillospiraceae bacterium]
MPYVIIFVIILVVIPTLPLDALPFEIPVPDFVLALAAAALMRLVVYVRGRNAKKYRKDVEYGSARWGTEKDIKPYIDPNPKNNIILTQTESLTMNSRPKPVKYARNKNVLVIGGSGSGKTRFFVKPNLMQCESEDFPVSFICTDPKGSILSEVGTLLKKRGYRIKVINTIDFKKSMRYNPFSYIRSEKDILKLVTALIENTKGDGKGGDEFWTKAEKLLYQALIGYIHYEAPPHEQNMNSLVEMINKMEVREDNENFKNSIDYLFEALEERAPQHFALRQYKKYKLAAGKTAKSILISCGARLAPFDIAEVRDLMSEDELELDNLGGYKKINSDTGEEETIKQKNALFVIISDTDSSFNFIVALLYSQLFNLLCDRAGNDFNGRLPVHCRFLLDEFANIGLIPNFEKLIATIRSREISACVILQAQSQLKAIYKDNMDTIIGNMDTTLFLGGKEKTTLEEISKMLGKETIDMFNTSISKGSQESHGQNFQKLGKELMSVDEIAVMDGERCILQVRGERPFLSRKYNIEKHPNYRFLSDHDPKQHFDVGKYLNSRAKLRKDDVYVVAEIDVSKQDN